MVILHVLVHLIANKDLYTKYSKQRDITGHRLLDMVSHTVHEFYSCSAHTCTHFLAFIVIVILLLHDIINK